MNKKNTSDKWKWLGISVWAVGGFSVVVGGWYYWLVYSSNFTNKNAIAELGQQGDSFAVLNTLFSGLTLLGVFIAIMYQRHELKRQEKEFKAQEEELKVQSKRQDKQQFENTFFNMLSLLNEIIKGLTVSELKVVHVGRGPEFVSILGREVFSKFKKELQTLSINESSLIKNSTIDEIMKNYGLFFYGYKTSKREYQGAGNQLGHYFRTLYAILKFVECSGLDYKSKKQYSNIARGQLSNNELYLLFYNCLWQRDFTPFRLLVEKYAFLEHLQTEEIGTKQLGFYQSNAYGAYPFKEMVVHSFSRDKYKDIFPDEKNFIVDEDLTY